MRALALCVTVGMFIAHRFRKRRRSKDLHKIPLGPGRLPLLGHIGILKSLKAKKVHEYFVNFAKAAGEGGMQRFVVLGETSVVLSSPRTVAAALNKATHLPKPAGVYNAAFMLGMKEPNMAMLSDPGEHGRIRRHLMRFFCAENVTMIVEQLAQEIHTTLAAIDAAAFNTRAVEEPAAAVGDATWQGSLPKAGEAGIYSGGPDGVLVDATAMAKGNLMRLVFRVFLGTENVAPLEVVADTMDHVTAVSGHPALYQLLKHGLLPGSRRYRRNWEALHKYHTELAREVYARPMPEGCTAFWATVRHAFPNAMSDAREFEAAAANLTLYMAASETTAASITHMLAALALDQDSQAAVAEELREVGLLATAEAPDPRGIDREDLAKLTMLDAVCHECLRLMPPSPVGGLRALAKDTKIGGYVVPKGTWLVIPPCALHTSEHAWGPDADKWRPDRWLEGRSVAAARMTDAGLPRFLAFFDGPANCLGQHLALVELKLVVASIISRLHVTMDNKRMPHMQTVDDYAAATVVSVSLKCDGPCWLRMRQRAPAAAGAAAGAAA